MLFSPRLLWYGAFVSHEAVPARTRWEEAAVEGLAWLVGILLGFGLLVVPLWSLVLLYGVRSRVRNTEYGIEKLRADVRRLQAQEKPPAMEDLPAQPPVLQPQPQESETR